ncbi:hypothetical protein QWY85_18265 [Neolewinella lacunae]|uniref:Anti-sigma factor n=1 Tax=Neolewinella lacunae TaxID=1517758 RepID=A0A923PQM2_9BACT|nr:hypothetical protein [Neolewinella lacunae]MBC6995689.1 hypothetical protein [Neolewinella lacunae]MDN3636618.1 hypothetical protein [Neolewinella lacunae]
MPTDKLEDFILQNRETFDAEAPAEGVWDRIEAALCVQEDDCDPFESFVAKRREDFDGTTPPPRLEGRIFAALDEVETAATPQLRTVQRRRAWLPLLGIAASLLLLLATAFTLGNSRGYRSAEEDRLAAEIARIDPDFAEVESFYRSKIADQVTAVTQANHDPQLIEDLAAIDEATEDIRNALLEVPVSQRADLVQKLIGTYRTKLDILLRIQRQLPPPPMEEATTQSNNNEI